VNEDPLIAIGEEDTLLISTYYLPIVIIKREDGSYTKKSF
jgi:trehalose 6-phosphate synthase/phosphatase